MKALTTTIYGHRIFSEIPPVSATPIAREIINAIIDPKKINNVFCQIFQFGKNLFLVLYFQYLFSIVSLLGSIVMSGFLISELIVVSIGKDAQLIDGSKNKIEIIISLIQQK